ncbi:MAG TPA: hypothetical protein VGO21_04650 [Candidatus Paceibacterota bacterium]|jgi:hypothetical protein|nr:hypothetical protein [Candidatus Paceibacterota bacterium]
MIKFFQKIPLFLSILFLVFSSAVFFYFYNQVENKNNQSQIKESDWQREVARRNEVKMLDHSVKIISEERAQLETHFAQSSDIVPFLDTIEELGRVALAKAAVASVNVVGDNSGLSVGMRATGTFDGLYKFLTLLENSPYELEFTSMDLQKDSSVSLSGKNAGVPQWSATFTIKLLSFIQ